MRGFGLVCFVLGAMAALGEWYGLRLPTAVWFFDVSRQLPWLQCDIGSYVFLWFGWLSVLLLLGFGLYQLFLWVKREPINPVTRLKMERFRSIRRGDISLKMVIGLMFLASLDQVLVGKKALVVYDQGRWYFPAFQEKEMKQKDFGLTENPDAPIDYRQLKLMWRHQDNQWLMLPIVPYDATGDTLAPRSKKMKLRGGLWHQKNADEPYTGLMVQYADVYFTQMKARYTVRDGVIKGSMDAWDQSGNLILRAERDGEVWVSQQYSGEGSVDELLNKLKTLPMRSLHYHPAPPIFEKKNYLGTTSDGRDVLAYLYSGLQLNFKAAVIFLPIVYLLGVSIGLLMGYWGGWFDLILQRLIEVLENIPFLFVVIILSSWVPDRFKGLPVVLTILIAFGWMGMTNLMRTAAYRDRTKDYVAAAKVSGASHFRIIFHHLLPNTLAILVTLVPFTFSGLVSSLTALDYLGFGLPPEYASWGRLLADGLSNFSAPWLVTSTFFCLVSLLVLITFIGESVREAFNPKSFIYYR